RISVAVARNFRSLFCVRRTSSCRFGEARLNPGLYKTREGEDEWSTSTGGHTQGRIHSDIGRQAPKLGSERTALRGLGDLPHARTSRESDPDFRVADERLVRADYAALRRWR